MFKKAVAGACVAVSFAGAQAAPSIQFDPSFESVAVGEVFDLVLKGISFGHTSAGLVIGNLTGGQKLNLTYTKTQLQVLKVTIDPRWTFASGNKEGTIDHQQGAVNGVAFGSFPATADDDFTIATITLKALAPGKGTVELVSGQFVGQVGGRAGQAITPTLPQATVTVVPEPEQWALLLLGLGVLGAWHKRGRSQRDSVV